MTTFPSEGPKRDQLDPVYRHSLREFWLIMCVWATCLVWTVGYCWSNGYDVEADTIRFVLGVPSWAFWGILVPWALATTFSVIYGLFIFVEEPLGEGEKEPDGMSGFDHSQQETMDG